jgi:hypothetical protein
MSRLKCIQELYEAEAVAFSMTFPDKSTLKKIVIGFSATPTTSEDLTVDLDSAGGSDYDTNIITIDPSAEGVTESMIMTFDDGEMDFIYNDGIDIAYTNTDVADISVSVYYEVAP